MVVGKRVEGFVNEVDLFSTQQAFINCVAKLVGDFDADLVKPLVDRQTGTFFASAGDCRIESDAVQPRRELAVSVKLVDAGECSNERFLDCFFGILATVQHSHHRREQLILVAFDQTAKRRFAAMAGFINQTFVITVPLFAHSNVLHGWGGNFFERSATTFQLGGAIVTLTAGGDVNFKLTFFATVHVADLRTVLCLVHHGVSID